MAYRGIARLDRKTKNLVKRLKSGDIAIIDHVDLDEVAARSLVETGVRIVLNAGASISGRYPNQGPLVLLQAGITLIDQIGSQIFELVEEGEELEVDGNLIHSKNSTVGQGVLLTQDDVKVLMEKTRVNLEIELDRFVENTLQYAKKEKSLILDLRIPRVRTTICGRHVLIVVRGQDYRADLRAIKSYIADLRPVIIAVDGGADACRELDLRPHIIIGDMDSVSDKALLSGAELVVHAYPDGYAPGMERVGRLGLNALTFPAPGTSEDIAMLLAYEAGASLIVAVGTHSNIIDFLEKGRPGMASTFLTRMKIGAILVDARGVSKLYRRSFTRGDLTRLLLAALLPILIIASVSPPIKQTVRLLMVWLRLNLHF